MTEETFLIIFLLPSFREIPRSTWDMGEPWSFCEQLWLLKCFRDSMVRRGQHLEDVGDLS